MGRNQDNRERTIAKDAQTRFDASANPESPFYLEECGCCGCYHHPDFAGDCREDRERFAYPEALYDLFAAAPDLLEACKDALAWWHSIPGHFDQKEPVWVEPMRTAIAKAEGHS